MLRVVLATEARRLARSPLRLAAVVVYLAAGLAALQVGSAHVAVLESNLAEGEARESRMQAQALGWFDAGEVGPEDRPWVDITTGLWADWYTGSHFGLAPTPLAAASVGVSDVRSNLVRLSRLATPFDTDEWRQLANPESQALGAMDLTFVFAFLLPLLVIVLAFDLRGFERDRGIEGLIALQAGALSPWVRARIVAVGIIAGIPTATLWLVAGVSTGALPAQTGGWVLGAGLLAAYLALWTAVAGAVAVRAGSANRSALALAGVWISTCVLVPALVNQAVRLTEPVGYSARITDAVRAERYELYEEPIDSLLPVVYAEFPDLAALPYASVEGERDPAADRHVYDVASHRAVGAAHADIATAERRRLALADWSMVVNPVHAFQSGMNRIAGTEATAYLAFDDAIVEAVRTKLHRILRHAWSREPVDRAGFVSLSAAVPEDLMISEAPPPLAWLTLLGWAGVAAVFARAR